MKRNQIAAIIVLLIVLPAMVTRDPSPWRNIVMGLTLIACGIFAGWPYWRGNKKALGISLGVAGCIVGVAVAFFLRHIT